VSEAKHTAGPWIAASRPSSVVGLPVVSQSGRSIASVTHFNLGEQFDNHDQESRANARLIAAAPELLSIVERFVALPGGAWHPERHAADEAELMLDARATLAKAGGRS
jgi:hypothetical protein